MEKTNLYIHFDLDWWKHSIPISQSIVAEQSIQRIVKNFSDVLFGSNTNIEIFVEADEEGWLVKTFSIAAIWVITAYTFTACADWVLKWLTWKNISEHSENITIILKETTTAFLSEPSMDLVEKNICLDDFYEAYDAKNSFYKYATANKEVLGIWFNKDDDFPIDRNQFPYKTIELKKEKTWNKFIDKFHDLLVVSPINYEKYKHLQWRVEDKISKEKFWVSMKDDDFYDVLFTTNLMIKEFLVKVRYNISIDSLWEEKIDKQSIIMVYEYNKVYKLISFPDKEKITSAPYRLPEKYDEVSNQTNLTI